MSSLCSLLRRLCSLLRRLCSCLPSDSNSDSDSSNFGWALYDSDSGSDFDMDDMFDRVFRWPFDDGESDSTSDSDSASDNPQNSQAESHIPSLDWSDGSDFVPDLHPFQGGGCGITEDWPCGKKARENDFFCAFMDKEVMSFIAQKTNEHYRWVAEQLNDEQEWQDTSPKELYVMLALMLLIPLHSDEDFLWGSHAYLNPEAFRKAMSEDRFKLLEKFLHFSDSENHDHHDQIWEVREIFSMLLTRFKKYFSPYQKLVIDESLTFKCRPSSKHNSPSKQHQQRSFYAKLFALRDCETGIFLDMTVYTGRCKDLPNFSKDDPNAVIKKLMDPYLGKGHVLFTDLLHTNPALYEILLDHKTGSCGTVPKNSKFLPKFNGQKISLDTQDDDAPNNTQDDDAANCHNKGCKKQKKGHPVMDRFIQKERAGKILAVKYKNDRQAVYFLSTIHKGEIVHTEEKHRGRVESIKVPDLMVGRTQYKRLIDDSECKLSDTECLWNPAKWPHRFFFHLIDVAMLNAYNMWLVVHNMDPTKLKVNKFQYKVASQLLKKYQ